MCCETISFDGANDPERCKCRAAVERAYKGLLSAGEPETIALQAAKRVYAHHHPEDPAVDAALTVERWLYAASAH